MASGVSVAGWLKIPKNKLNMVKTKKLLTVIPKDSGHNSKGPQKVLKLYRESADFLYVPRRSPFLPESVLLQAENRTSYGSPITLEDNIVLRDYQVPVVDQAMASFEKNPYGGILVAAAGAGKTQMGLEIVRRLGRTTLVIVHKSFLLRQWVARILGDETTPGVFPNAKVGIVQQGKCEFEGKDIVIAMAQSLVSRDYPAELFTWPGLVMEDEIHVFGAETFCECAPMFPSTHRLGLTATDRRKDGCEKAFFYHVGPIIASVKREKTSTMTSKIRVINWDDPTFKKSQFVIWGSKGKFNSAKWMTSLGKDAARNNMIWGIIKKGLLNKRKILILSDRREQLDLIGKLFDSDSAMDLYKCDFYIGGRKQADLDIAAKADLVLGTYGVASTGLDIPDLDMLIMATPRSEIEQSVGRIERFVEGKPVPIVIDIVDSAVQHAKRLHGARKKHYANVGAKIV